MRKVVNRSDRVGIFDRQLKVYKCSMRGTGSEEWKNGSTGSNKKKRQLPHPCTTQPARIPTGSGQVGHSRKETRSKIKACPTHQGSLRAQRLYNIDARGAGGGQPRRDDCGREQHERGEDHWQG